MKPIMTVKEARKIMGKDAEKFTDEEITKIIDDLDFIAGMAIKDFKSKNLKNVDNKTDQA